MVRRRYLGEAQIVDGHGRVLARMPAEDGEGVIVADILPGEVAGPKPGLPEGFWIPETPPAFLEAWGRLNRHGEQYYREVALPHRRRVAWRDGGR